MTKFKNLITYINRCINIKTSYMTFEKGLNIKNSNALDIYGLKNGFKSLKAMRR